MDIDPITLEVIRNKIDVITEEMESCLIKSAYCVIVKEGSDATTAIFSAQGEMIAQAVGNPMQFGQMVPVVQTMIELFPPHTMNDGDMFLTNNPYTGGTHLPCVFVVMPVIYKGELTAFTCCVIHNVDIGGKTPGSMVTDATEIYQEGLIIPPLRLYEKGQLNETVVSFLKSNVRTPESAMGDLMAEVAACQIGKKGLVTLLDAYGRDTFLRYVRELLDRTEALTRRKIEEIPDGTYTFEDYLDNDGVDLDKRVKIVVTVNIKGSEMEVDFRGSSPQVRGSINMPAPSSALSVVAYFMRVIMDPSIPNNAGYYRPIRVITQPGSIVHPLPPAAVSIRAHGMHRIYDALCGAMVKALAGKLPAANAGALQAWNIGGVDPLTGKAWVYMESNWCGSGARPNKDGIDLITIDLGNTSNTPAEAMEIEFPLRVVRYEYRQDSGGAGEYRGGLGIERVIQLTRGEASGSTRCDRHYTSPWGLYGGLPGARWQASVMRQSGEVIDIPSKSFIHMRAGDELHSFTGGGGGYGDPLKRTPELVLDDVLNGKISIEVAREQYGVVLDGQSTTVDHSRTEALRRELREKRGDIWWTYDRGPGLGRG